MLVTVKSGTLVIEATLHTHSVTSCARLIVTQLFINTVYLRTKPMFIYFSGNHQLYLLHRN